MNSVAEDYRSQVSGLAYRNQAFIDGKYVPAASGRTFDKVSPINGRLLTTVAECDREDVERAVTAARTAFDKGVLVTRLSQEAQDGARQARRAHDEASRRAVAARDARYGQAHRQFALRRHPGFRPHHPVVWRGLRQGL